MCDSPTRLWSLRIREAISHAVRWRQSEGRVSLSADLNFTYSQKRSGFVPFKAQIFITGAIILKPGHSFCIGLKRLLFLTELPVRHGLNKSGTEIVWPTALFSLQCSVMRIREFAQPVLGKRESLPLTWVFRHQRY